MDNNNGNNHPLPLWFTVLFLGTVFFGIIYLVYNHLIKNTSTSTSQTTQNREQPKQKTEETFDYSKNVGNTALIETGKNLYNANCAVCHGNTGEGGTGPNLTDNYWILGNSLQDIEKSIADGAPGMPGWKKQLNDEQIKSLVIYIVSIQNSNPPHAKPPEGQPGKLY